MSGQRPRRGTACACAPPLMSSFTMAPARGRHSCRWPARAVGLALLLLLLMMIPSSTPLPWAAAARQPALGRWCPVPRPPAVASPRSSGPSSSFTSSTRCRCRRRRPGRRRALESARGRPRRPGPWCPGPGRPRPRRRPRRRAPPGRPSAGGLSCCWAIRPSVRWPWPSRSHRTCHSPPGPERPPGWRSCTVPGTLCPASCERGAGCIRSFSPAGSFAPSGCRHRTFLCLLAVCSLRACVRACGGRGEAKHGASGPAF
ncbi:hypothetical protein H696_01841 [Fonticula alba]|uniref:Uncharacterized protein n=1 Tax=Fonticula alba TaxID=691883 RepID=A0A058Z9A3_FONAL|nr:hypothetical protein H696_01841 [Fonticula alba]KCV70894.1 hypothetical protein H696_01841 [Fonticula alba]|eukprot:XP_009494017.1 hypothetical protein H696_01841 [Fonticula alba]